MSPFIIRNELPADHETIAAVTRAAFADHPHSRQTEQFIVDALRRAGALTLSLVAEADNVVVGHVACSPVVIGNGSAGWYGIGPVSVLPAMQGRGIGQQLLRRGLAHLRALGAGGCVLVGEAAFYGRFGFAHEPALRLTGVPPEYLLALPLAGVPAAGEVRFHPAFGATS
jgi:putative acetyltransferase